MWIYGEFMGVHVQAFRHSSGFNSSVSAAINSREADPLALAALGESHSRYTGRNVILNHICTAAGNL